MLEKVLIVDDERAIAQLTAMWMKHAGYAPVVAYDGRSGLEASAAQHPDLIFLDIRMPDLDGFEVNRKLKESPDLADIPVIFLSAHAQETTRQEATASGTHFLSKPCDPKCLIGAARAALSQRASQLSACAAAHA